jgi:hopene-associated glycosyltransferase HpnB
VTALVVLGSMALAAWTGLLLHPARPWDLRPIAEDEPEPPPPARWPSVAVLVPARNEAALLPLTLPALLAQEYAGAWSVILVDDRSEDGTRVAAEAPAAGNLVVVAGRPLPAGWVGKPWALEQALQAAPPSDYVLLTDADIRHAPGSLRRLVAEAEADGLDLVSRMARLRCASLAERLLVPPFLFFFQCLYPMRRANDPGSRLAAAAGGCMLVRRAALERAGGLAAIRDAVIDDLALARSVKRLGGRTRLAVSRSQVVSVRSHDSLGSVWRMVARTAFTQLRRSHALTALTVCGLLLLFPLPPVLVAYGLAAGDAALAGVGGAAWLAMAAAFSPTVRFFRLGWAWAATLPAAGSLYAAMTLHSALRGPTGR